MKWTIQSCMCFCKSPHLSRCSTLFFLNEFMLFFCWTIASRMKTMIFGKRQLYPYWRFMWHKHLHHVLMRHYGSKWSLFHLFAHSLFPLVSIVLSHSLLLVIVVCRLLCLCSWQALWLTDWLSRALSFYWKPLWWSRKSKQIRDDRKHAKKSDVLLCSSSSSRNRIRLKFIYGKPILFCGFKTVKPILCGIL